MESVFNVHGSGPGGQNVGMQAIGTGTRDDPKYVCWNDYASSWSRHNIEVAYQPTSGEKVFYIKSHPYYSSANYNKNQDCFFTVRVFDGGVSNKQLRMRVLEGHLAGDSYLAVRNNNDYNSIRWYGNLTGKTFTKMVQAGRETRDTISVNFVSGSADSDLSTGFVIEVREV